MKVLAQEDFHAIDRRATGLEFDVHNELGRFFDETVFQRELASRCRDAGFETHREVLVRAMHNGFFKDYYLDLLIAPGATYELKATDQLTAGNEKQVINYLLLTGQSHGKLFNFRPASIEYRFVSTMLTVDDRRKFVIIDEDWEPTGAQSSGIPHVLSELLQDWGCFLDVNLYRDALLHFLGGSKALQKAVPVRTRYGEVGTQKLHVLDDRSILHVSAVSRHAKSYLTHLHRLLNNTALENLHWINFNKRHITLQTLTHSQNDSAVNDSAMGEPATQDQDSCDARAMTTPKDQNDSAINDSAGSSEVTA